MSHRIITGTFPVYIREIAKFESRCQTMQDVVTHFRNLIEAHHCARLLGVFDHMGHTRRLADGEVAEGILDACNVIFCFGMSIPTPEALALRPRSIGITELADRFVISFLEPPMPLVNSAMESWAAALVQSPDPVAQRA